MLNRSVILFTAWADYRRDVRAGYVRGIKFVRNGSFDRERFAYCLRCAWEQAKFNAARKPQPAPVAKVVTDPARVEAIRAELQAQDYSNVIPWERRTELQAELERLVS